MAETGVNSKGTTEQELDTAYRNVRVERFAKSTGAWNKRHKLSQSLDFLPPPSGHYRPSNFL